MTKYLFTYHGGGMPESEAEQAAHMAAWGEWMEANATAFTDMGAPVGASKTVGASSVKDGGLIGGYSIIEVSDIDTAAEIAKGCPVITLSGGTVEVGETFEIEM